MSAHAPFIPGLHFFCDHCCWRCPLGQHCRVHALWLRTPEPPALSARPAARVASTIALSLQVTLEEVAVIARLAGVDGAGLSGCGQLPGTGASEALPDDPRVLFDRRAEGDSLVRAGRAYATQCWPVVRAVSSVLAGRRDTEGMAAAERLEEVCATIASKIFRSVSSASQPDHDAADIQNDAHGSAKVALLLIEESRQAWRVLMRPGAAAANGAPSKFVGMLDALEAALLARFPRALEFVRPGFDTGELGGAGGEIARAMLVMTAPGGRKRKKT